MVLAEWRRRPLGSTVASAAVLRAEATLQRAAVSCIIVLGVFTPTFIVPRRQGRAEQCIPSVGSALSCPWPLPGSFYAPVWAGQERQGLPVLEDDLFRIQCFRV